MPWIGPRLSALLGPPTEPDAPPTDRDRDLAAALQVVLEERLLALARRVRARSGERRLACAGGVFLNGCANWRIRTEAGFDAVFFHPISHDAGTALGAAQAVAMDHGERPDAPLTELFLGPDLSADATAAACRASGLALESVDDPAARAAELAAAGHVVGFVQGRSEVGPRALGARSILADPRRAEMKDIVNGRVKRRAAEIPAVIHVDGTGRVQTVHADTNPVLHRCVARFAELTGVPVLLNTSFNLRGEPMVQTAADALDCMRRTELDHCLIGHWHVAKHQPKVQGPGSRVEMGATAN